jgi:phospholipid/cholesterol/gamma-HCH transport system substrate-binding protein
VIRRSTYLQLIAFAVISVVGILYVGLVQVKLFTFHGPYTVKTYFADSGGIFPTANVTERGVSVGKVKALHLVDQGGGCKSASGCVEVDLAINHGTKIPAQGVKAQVADLSAVGEQYVDLTPTTDSGPMLKADSVVPSSRTSSPVDANTLLLNLNSLLKSVNNKQLATVIDELGKGFDNLGPTLQRLVDNGNALTETAQANLPQTLTLINDGKTVLDTQNDVAAELKSFAASFKSFSGQLVKSDPDLRGVLTNGIGASKQVTALLKDTEPVLPTLLSNLVTVQGIQAVRLPQIQTIIEIYPGDTADGFHVTPGDGTAHFGMILDPSSTCETGYSSTVTRGNSGPADWGGPANLDAYCHGDGITTTLRGSRNVPKPAGDDANVTNEDPFSGQKYGTAASPSASPSSSSATTAQDKSAGSSSSDGTSSKSETLVPLSYDPSTGKVTGMDGKTYLLGYDGPTAPLFGSDSYKWLLVAPTMK